VGFSAIRIEGGRELRRALRTAAGDLDDLKTAHKQVAAVVASAAQEDAPKRSGKLAGSIRPNSGQRYARVSVGNNRSTAAGIPYAGPIHWGWPTGSPKLPAKVRNIRGREWYIAPNPFVTDAATRTEPVWSRICAAALEDIVDQIGETANGKGP